MKKKDLIVRLKGFKDFVLEDDFYFYFSDSVYLHDLGYPCSENKNAHYIIVPKGFSTDFGSVPRLFQGIISPVGNASKAYVLHDYLCVLAKNGRISRKKCDLLFKEALKQVNVRPFMRNVLYYAVRAYAKIKGLK